MTEPSSKNSVEHTIALMQRIGCGQAKPGDPGINDLVARELASIGERSVPGGKKEPFVTLTPAGLVLLRQERAKAVPKPRVPTMGKARSVLYVPTPHKERAALIVDVEKNGVANLIVFGKYPGDEGIQSPRALSLDTYGMSVFMEKVPYSRSLTTPHTWHWIVDSPVHYPPPVQSVDGHMGG